MEIIQHLLESIHFSNLNALLLVGVAIFGGTIGGRLFKRIRVPQVVGYIIIGILAGKMGANLLNDSVLASFAPFNDFALGIIGFLIGGELKTATLKKYGSQFTWILLFEAFTTFIVTSALIFAAVFLIFGDIRLSLVMALLLGAISAATAAAGTTDVLWESKTRGALTTTILGIIALDDILSLFLFAIVASFAGIILGTGAGNLSHEMLMLLYEIGGALLLGGLSGLGLARLLKESSDRERTMTFSMGGILLVLGLAATLGLDTILAAMVMGVVMTNVASKKSGEIFHLVESFAPPLYVMFFVFVGASLNIGQMTSPLYIIAAAYLIARSSGKMLGAFLGATVGKSPQKVRRYLPLSLFSQSGVAIGLAIIASQRFPGIIGTSISLVVTATTFIVQILGPVVLKYAVHKAGEAGLNINEDDIIRRTTVSDVMDDRVPLLNEGLSINHILEIISDSDSLFFPVVDSQQKLKGVLSIEGVKNSFYARELTDMILTMDLMEPVAMTATSDEALEKLLDEMKRKQEEFVPVIDEQGIPVGIVEQRGIHKYISRKLFETQQLAAD